MTTKRLYNDTQIHQLLEEYRRTGALRLRGEVVERMRPLVESVARKFAGREPLEDLVSEGFVGLIRAIDRYSPDRATKFSTFATHLVAGQIRHYLRDRGHLIRQPAWLQELNTRVQRITTDLEQKLGRSPSVEEIAAAANLTEEGVEELLSAQQAARIVRMESASTGDEEEYLEVDPEKFRSRDYVTLQLPIEDRIVLENALAKLKELEQKVLYNFFFQDRNQSEIARDLGISCNYTGYVLRNGLKHLRERLPQDSALERGGVSPEDSVLDPLTGVYNAAHFQRRLSEEITRAHRSRGLVSVCCLQLPLTCPDSAVLEAAELLRREVRKADVVARTDRREFGLIFPDTGPAAARVATALAEKLYPVIDAPVLAAAATYPDAGRTAHDLFHAAREGAFPASAPLSQAVLAS